MRSVSPELARAEVAELVRILTWKVVVVLSLYKGTELVRISSCRIKTLDTMFEGESLQGGKLQGSGSGGGGKRQQWKGEGALVINRDQGTTDQGTSTRGQGTLLTLLLAFSGVQPPGQQVS